MSWIEIFDFSDILEQTTNNKTHKAAQKESLEKIASCG
jgi:hypothetical protein